MKQKLWSLGFGLFLMLAWALPSPVQAAKSDAKKEKEVQQLIKAIDDADRTTLNEFYKSQKDGQAIIKNAAGYGVFSAFNMNIFLLSSTRGRGVIHDQRSGSKTYMKAMKLGYGVGAGAQDYRVLFVFDDAATMKKVLDGGWFVKGDASAVATTKSQEGIEEGAEAQVLKGVRVYRFVDNGIAAQATVDTAKIWPDEDLNKKKM